MNKPSILINVLVFFILVKSFRTIYFILDAFETISNTPKHCKFLWIVYICDILYIMDTSSVFSVPFDTLIILYYISQISNLSLSVIHIVMINYISSLKTTVFYKRLAKSPRKLAKNFHVTFSMLANS